MTGKSPLLLLTLAILLAAVLLLLLSPGPGAPRAKAGREDQEPAAQKHPRPVRRGTGRPPAPRRVKAPAPEAGKRQEKQKKHRMPFFVMTDRKALRDLRKRETRPLPPPPLRRPKPSLATILQLPEKDPRALFLQEWIKEKTRTEREYLPGGRRFRGATAERADAFNQLVQRRTEELRRELGDQLVHQVAARVPLFRMDRTTGRIYRVDLKGNRRKEREVPDE